MSMGLGDSFAEVVRDYTRLERKGAGTEHNEADHEMELGHAAMLEGMRRAIGIMCGIPPEEAAHGGDIAHYIAAWQSSHHAFLFTPDGAVR